MALIVRCLPLVIDAPFIAVSVTLGTVSFIRRHQELLYERPKNFIRMDAHREQKPVETKNLASL